MLLRYSHFSNFFFALILLAGAFHVEASDESFTFKVKVPPISFSIKKGDERKNIYEELNIDFDTHVVCQKNLQGKYEIIQDFDMDYPVSDLDDLEGETLEIRKGSYYFIEIESGEIMLGFKSIPSELTLGEVKRAALGNLKVTDSEDNYLLSFNDNFLRFVDEGKFLQELGIASRDRLKLMHKEEGSNVGILNLIFPPLPFLEESESDWEIANIIFSEKKIGHFFSIDVMKGMGLGLSLAGILFVVIWWGKTAYQAKKRAMKKRKKRRKRRRKSLDEKKLKRIRVAEGWSFCNIGGIL